MTKSNISGIVLAAGASSRMDKNKILLPMGDKTVIERVIETLIGTTLSEVIIIGGRDYELLKDTLKSYPVNCYENKDYHEGQSTSMRLGLSKIRADAKGCFFFMGDQPLIDAENINHMIRIFSQSNHLQTIVTPVGQEGRGTPVLFGFEWFDALKRVTGDRGGRSIIKEAFKDVISYYIDRNSFFWDIDDEHMYQKVLNNQNFGSIK